jgi:hypothetical protein
LLLYGHNIFESRHPKLSKNLFFGTSCLGKSGITSALIEIQSSLYAQFKANKMPSPVICHTNIFSTVMFSRYSNLTFHLVFLKTDQNCIHEEIRSRLNSGNACYHAVQSSRLLSRNVKIKIYKTIILLVVLYGCETLSLTLREEHRLRFLRTGCLGEYLDLRVMK